MNGDNESGELELLKRYRRASDARPSLPEDAVREAILAEGRRAAARNSGAVPHNFGKRLSAANRPRWRYAALGTVCAAVLAGFLVVPRFLMEPQEEAARVSNSAAPETRVIAPEQPAAPKPEAAPAAPDVSGSLSPQDTRAERKAAPPLAQGRAKVSDREPSIVGAQLAAPEVSAGKKFEGSAGLIGGASAQAGGEAARPMENRLSSDLQQVTVTGARTRAFSAPAPISAAPEPVSPIAGNEPAPSGKEAGTASGSAVSSDLEEVVVTRQTNRRAPTPLISAVNWGRAAKAATLLQSGEGSVTETDSKGRTPLLRAVEQRRLDLVQLLLAHGADPYAPDAAGETPLSIARQRQLTDIAAALEAAAKQPPR